MSTMIRISVAKPLLDESLYKQTEVMLYVGEYIK